MYSITHYYNKRFAPLRTLSELTEGDALALITFILKRWF